MSPLFHHPLGVLTEHVVFPHLIAAKLHSRPQAVSKLFVNVNHIHIHKHIQCITFKSSLGRALKSVFIQHISLNTCWSGYYKINP